jgi:hypothetical protein
MPRSPASRGRPTIIVIYAPTRQAAHALRDVLCDMLDKSDNRAVCDSDIHLIGVGEDSADEEYDAPRPPK